MLASLLRIILLTATLKILERGLDKGPIISERKAVQRKEDDLKKKNDQMLRTIGQLTLERDFLQDCFRQAGEAIPRIPEYDQKG